MIINSHIATGKTWLVSLSRFLLPPFVSYNREEGTAKPGDGDQFASTFNSVTLSPDGNIMPLFTHVVALSLDIHSSDPKALSVHPLYTSMVSRVALVPSRKHIDVETRPIGVAAMPHLALDQGDEFCLSPDLMYGSNVSLICETHCHRDQLSDYAPHAFVMNAGVLVDDDLIASFCECLPMAKNIDTIFRPYLLRWLKYQCHIAKVSPLHLLQCMRRQGLVATKEETKMYNINPANIFTAVGRLTGVIASNSVKREIAKRFPSMVAKLAVLLPLTDEVLVEYNTAPNNINRWADVLIGLCGGSSVPKARTYYSGSDSFSPIPFKDYPLQDLLKSLVGLPPVAVPSLLQVCMEMECWQAVNNTAALLEEEGDGENNFSDTLRCLRVPVSYLCLSGQDTMDMHHLRHLLFRLLHCTVNLSALASVGYSKKSSKQREKARLLGSRLEADADSPSTGTDETESCISFKSRYTTVSSSSLARSARSGRSGRSGRSLRSGYTGTEQSSTSVTFFGDNYEKYLPRLVIDMSVLIDGLGVSESHESPIQQTITTIMKIRPFEKQCVTLVRLAMVLSAGLPPGLALPLETKTDLPGVTMPALCAPYKVFPGGDCSSKVSTKFSPSKTLFSRVLLHIPQAFLVRCPTLEILMVLGEKYSLPQPDASVLTMKL
ncbi:hypothetical protein KIPB_001359, partial [Kipferlia bialata]|eukprot:g1359.t1